MTLKKINADEAFLLQDRANDRKNWTIRLSAFVGALALVLFGLTIQATCAVSSQATVDWEQARAEQARWVALNAPWASMEEQKKREHEATMTQLALPLQLKQIETNDLREQQKLSQFTTCLLQGPGAKVCSDSYYPERVEEQRRAEQQEADQRHAIYHTCLENKHTNSNECQEYVNELLSGAYASNKK